MKITQKNITASLVQNSYQYTGSAITSDVTILGLTKGVDYTVDNVTETEKGTYTVKITGIGDYAGERIVYWQIVAGGLYIAAIPDQTYTGKAIKPVLDVYCDGVLLTAGKDYTITYKFILNEKAILFIESSSLFFHLPEETKKIHYQRPEQF